MQSLIPLVSRKPRVMLSFLHRALIKTFHYVLEWFSFEPATISACVTCRVDGRRHDTC
jgi:hypothetical protein